MRNTPNPALRSLFVFSWFILLPALLALGSVPVILALSSGDGTGALAFVRGLVEEQRVPAVIVFFTIYEMALYSLKERLPGAKWAGFLGPDGLPRELRAEFEQAGVLLEESRRILAKYRAAVERNVPAPARQELRDALDALDATMLAVPVDPESFREDYDRASSLAQRQLGRWQKSDLREYSESLIVALLVAALLRVLVVEAFKIPSGSMLPTLQIQDHIFVNKAAYGPTLPFSKTRMWRGMPPKRGDVIVFEYPDPDPNPRTDYIKRVIALPGDTLLVEGGHPILNGWPVPHCSAGYYEFEETSGVTKRGDLDVEFLGDYSYLTFFEENSSKVTEGPYSVAPGEVWVLGDARNNSSDSRRWNHGLGGGAPFANIKGRALFVWLSFDRQGAVTWDRLLTQVMGRPKLPKVASPTVVAAIERCLAQRPSKTLP